MMTTIESSDTDDPFHYEGRGVRRLPGIVLAALALWLAAGAGRADAFPATEVYRETAGAVVLVVASGPDGKGGLTGAGSIISPEGLVVTNAHVVVDKATGRPYERITVYTKPREVTGDLRRDLVNRHGARVLRHDAGLDLALLELEGTGGGLPVMELADPADIQVGEEVVAIGHPERGGLWSLTYGRISGQIADQAGVSGKDVFQTDTSVNRGNSGGPLLDRRGYMVGVNTNIARVGAGNLPITGVNFAVKSSVLKAWLEREGYRVAYGKRPLETEGAGGAGLPPSAEAARPQAATAKSPSPVQGVEPAELPVSAGGEAGISEVESQPAVPAPEMDRERSALEELESDTILTPVRPYKEDALFEQVEREMEGLMDEMRRKIRR